MNKSQTNFITRTIRGQWAKTSRVLKAPVWKYRLFCSRLRFYYIYKRVNLDSQVNGNLTLKINFISFANDKLSIE